MLALVPVNPPKKQLLLPADEPMWVKWRESEGALNVLDCSGFSQCQLAVKDECTKLLAEAKDCIDSKPRWSTRYSLWFWRLMHRLDENMLLIWPEPRLATEALYISEVFRRNVTDPVTRDVWWPHLTRAVAALDPQPPESNASSAAAEGPPAQRQKHSPIADDAANVTLPEAQRPSVLADDATRQVLRSVLHILNEHTDRGFRNYAMNGSIQLWSTTLLMAIFALGLLVYPDIDLLRQPPHPLPTAAALLLGAAGAIISNMISESAFLVPTGQTAGSFLYYLVVVPAVGALSGLFAIAVEHAQLLFSIVDDTNLTSAPIKIVVGPRAVAFGLMVLAVVSGFLGQWVIRSTMGELRARLYGDADKAITGADASRSMRALRASTWT